MGDVTLLRLAPAVVYFNNQDIGYTSLENPIQIQDTPKEVELFAAQEGESPIDAVITGHTCLVTVPTVEVTPLKLAMAIPNAVLVGGLVTIKNMVGLYQRALAKELKIVRLIGDTESADPDDIFVFGLASPAAKGVQQVFDPKKQQEFPIVMRVWHDLTTKEFYHVGA